jgi:hypothetical protein
MRQERARFELAAHGVPEDGRRRVHAHGLDRRAIEKTVS